MRGSNINLRYALDARHDPFQGGGAAYWDSLSVLVEDIESEREKGHLSDTEVKVLLKLAIRRQMSVELRDLVSRAISPWLARSTSSSGIPSERGMTENDYAG